MEGILQSLEHTQIYRETLIFLILGETLIKYYILPRDRTCLRILKIISARGINSITG